MSIRQAQIQDVSRIAEILVFNNRVNYYPIFQDEHYSFHEMQVISIAQQYTSSMLERVIVYDDGIIRGFIQLSDHEIEKCYVDVFFQGQGIGSALMKHAKQKSYLYCWVLEKNTRAIRFYEKHGFHRTDKRKLEEGTAEYLLMMEYKA